MKWAGGHKNREPKPAIILTDEDIENIYLETLKRKEAKK